MPEATPLITDPEVMNFQMPGVLAGETVSWYTHGTRKTNLHPQLAIVLKVDRRSVKLKTLVSERILEACRHVDDPRLAISSDMREDGAWEYSPAHKFRSQLEMRVSQLEKKVSDLESDSVPKATKKSS